MRARFADLLVEAAARRSAVGAFTCYNFETAAGVLEAAERRDAGVVLLVSEASFRSRAGPLLAAALVAMVDRSPAAACVQLDHVGDLVVIEAALELGVGAVMADGSGLPLEDNAALVAAAAGLARRFGADVEGELGRIEGEEDVAVAAAAGALTDPDNAGRFAATTGVACLAVSIGNVHGTYRSPPQLDWPRLEAIERSVDVPLSLHGASGLRDSDLAAAISRGVAKVNVNTELRERYLDVTEERLAAVKPGARVLELNLAQAEAVAALVSAKLDVLARPGDASAPVR